MKEVPPILKSGKQKVACNLHLPKREKPPVIIICHGLAGSKDSPHLVRMAKFFVKNGFAVLRFDFRCHKNKSDGKPEDLTYSKAVNDLKVVVNFLRKSKLVDKDRIGVFGGSFGGRTTILTVGKYDRVKAVATWGSPVGFVGDYKKEMKEVREKGYFEYKSGFRIGIKFYLDYKKHDMIKSVKNISVPFLIIHGSKDSIVPVSNAYRIFKAANEPKKLIVFKGSEHWYADTKFEKRLNAVLLDWFNKFV